MSPIFKNPDTGLDMYREPTFSFSFFFCLELISGSQRKEADSLSDLSIFTEEFKSGNHSKCK